ncbi:MAG: alpha-L-fucosidase, partial [Promethearchaeota archaeon]
MKYTADKKSISKHEVPKWYHNAKLGIFIHWGLYSVPAFAVTGVDLVESMKKGLEEHFHNNPYAEWYLNTLRISGSPTQKYHLKTYGKDYSYDDF